MRDCALAWGPGKGRVPEWLQKWVALCLEYVELEQMLLPAQLLAIPPPLGNFTAETASSQAKGKTRDLSGRQCNSCIGNSCIAIRMD